MSYEPRSMSDMLSVDRIWDSQSTCSSDRISPVAVPPGKVSQLQLHPGRIRSVVTNLIVEEGITDVLSDSGHGLNVVLGFLVALGIHAFV